MFVSQVMSYIARKRRIWLYLATSLLLSSFFMVSCSNPLSGGNATPTGPGVQPAPAQVALAKLSWCGKPFILFRDEHATPTPVVSATATATATTTPVSGTPTVTVTVTPGGTATATPTPSTGGAPTTITDWSQVEPNLGFTVYLPTTLPHGTCLESATGTLHDPVLGGNFIIGYVLPDQKPISISEAPQKINGLTFQCNPSSNSAPKIPVSTLVASPTPSATPNLICTGVKDTTNIVFSEQGDVTALTQFFNALQPDINWVPAS
jgi:hypothetical protein